MYLVFEKRFKPAFVDGKGIIQVLCLVLSDNNSNDTYLNYIIGIRVRMVCMIRTLISEVIILFFKNSLKLLNPNA